MLWFYLTGVTILIGGEVNAIIEQAAARTGDPEAKAAGEKLPDESARVRSGRSSITRMLKQLSNKARLECHLNHS